MRKDYDTEAMKLVKAVNTAIESFQKFPPSDLTNENVNQVISVYSEWRHSILNPEPAFKKIASLNHYVQQVFTYFNEGNGETVEYFWKQLKVEQLGYPREDQLRKAINRGKIKHRMEYDLVVDNLVIAEQEQRISQHEAEQLNEMLGAFRLRSKTN